VIYTVAKTKTLFHVFTKSSFISFTAFSLAYSQRQALPAVSKLLFLRSAWRCFFPIRYSY